MLNIAIKGVLVPCKNLKVLSENEILASANDAPVKIYFRRVKPNIAILSVTTEKGYTRDGIIISARMNLRGYERALIFHFTYDVSCREEPCNYPILERADELAYCPWIYPVHLSNLDALAENIKISKILLKSANLYTFILPISDNARGYITCKGKSIHIVLNRMRESVWNNAHIVAIGFGNDPYILIEDILECVADLIGKKGLLRKYKEFPIVFKYLGWCTWNAFWRNIDEEKILKALKEFRKLNIPVKFFLIDDGWMSEEEGMLLSFEASRDKFPQGLKQLVNKLKRGGVKYVGLWHTLNGYWKGIHPDSELAKEFRENLIKIKDKGLVPNPNKALRFFTEWYKFLANCEFDFVKVDNQSFVARTYARVINVEHASRKLHLAIETAAYLNSLEVLNCMGQQPETYFNWFTSSVSRNCIDYTVPHKKSRDKLHLYFNSYNALWMSTLVWPDWDMFQSHDPWGLQQAVSRAISGGPVYITDEPEKVVPEIVRKIALSDGVLPRPNVPALPTKDCLMNDPYNEPIPLKLFTKVTVTPLGDYGLIATFNITKDDIEVRGSISPSDAKLRERDYLVFEYFSKEHHIVTLNEMISFELKPMEVKLFILAPMVEWFIPLGLHNVFVMPATIDRVILSENEILVLLKDVGEFVGFTMDEVLVNDAERFSEGIVITKCNKPIVRVRLVK